MTEAVATPEGILLEHVAKQLVDDPAGVVVTETRDGDFLKLHLAVAEADVGKVIGRPAGPRRPGCHCGRGASAP